MGQKVSERTTIEATADVIRDVVLDLAAYPEWADGVSQAEVVETDDQGRPSVGRFEVDAKVAQVGYTIRYTLSDTRIAWTLIEGETITQLDGSYDLTPKGDVTDVVYTVEADVNMPLPGFLKKRAAKQIVEAGLKGLKRRAEARS